MNERRFQISKILLVEDDLDDREFFRDALADVAPDINLFEAENGVQGLEFLTNSGLPDLIFLDLNMPLKNGYECLEDIKKDENFRDKPVIIFSTSLQPEAANVLYDNGASLYIVKPNSFTDLKILIQKALTVVQLYASANMTRESFILQT